MQLHICQKHRYECLSAWTVGKVVNVKVIWEAKLPDGSHLLGGLVDQEALASTKNSRSKVVKGAVYVESLHWYLSVSAIAVVQVLLCRIASHPSQTTT
jgi:hypothetical protein